MHSHAMQAKCHHSNFKSTYPWASVVRCSKPSPQSQLHLGPWVKIGPGNLHQINYYSILCDAHADQVHYLDQHFMHNIWRHSQTIEYLWSNLILTLNVIWGPSYTVYQELIRIMQLTGACFLTLALASLFSMMPGQPSKGKALPTDCLLKHVLLRIRRTI